MKICEIFSSIEGEGIRAGYPCTFIRSVECNLRCKWCFGIKPGRNIPKVHMVNSVKDDRLNFKQSAKMPLNKVKVGDEIFTYDDNLNLISTTVTNIISREVTEWYEVKINNTLYYITPEHPIFTTLGMKQVKDLQVGDIILHSTLNDLNSMRMKLHNPMKDKNISNLVYSKIDYQKNGEKLRETIRQKQLEGTYKSSWESLTQEQKDEVCKKISQSKLREKNPNWIDNYKERNYTDLKVAIKKSPENYNCELCGINGTQKSLFVHHIDNSHENDSIENLSVVCSKCHNQIHERGYNFWTNNRKDGKKNLMAIANANGYSVEAIKHIDITKHPHYKRPYGPKPLTVFNLSCYPYNTYLLDTMWVHNCDSTYSFKADENSREMSVKEIVAECDKLGNYLVTFTGGEPLIQKDALELIKELISRGYRVNVETNGAVDLAPFIEYRNSDMWAQENLIFTVDYKCPSSGMEDKMISSNWKLAGPEDVMKFVVGSKEDLDCMRKWVKEHSYLYNHIFVSPVFGKIEPKEIVEFLKDNNLQNIRLQLQLHKFVYPPEMRGV